MKCLVRSRCSEKELKEMGWQHIISDSDSDSDSVGEHKICRYYKARESTEQRGGSRWYAPMWLRLVSFKNQNHTDLSMQIWTGKFDAAKKRFQLFPLKGGPHVIDISLGTTFPISGPSLFPLQLNLMPYTR